MQLFILVLMLGLTWALFVRPQQKRLKRQKQLVTSLSPGDRVVTAGGMIGTVTAVRTGDMDVELSPGMSVRMLTGAVTRRWTEPADADADRPELGAETGLDGSHRSIADADQGPTDHDPDDRGPAA